MKEELNGIKRTEYTLGMFNEFKAQKQIDRWDSFPELMWSLGYDMDSRSSFEKYRERIMSKQKTVNRDTREDTLNLLRRADRQTVGNFLFSEGRYYTHQARGIKRSEYDYLCQIIKILESKYEG